MSLQLINDLGNRYRLVSSINNHGYTPRGKLFTLKTVFKDPTSHKFVSFRAVDEAEPSRQVTLDGSKELIAVPVSCSTKPKIVHVLSNQKSKLSSLGRLSKKNKIYNRAEVKEEHIYKKNEITRPIQVVHTVDNGGKRQHITHIYLRKQKKDAITYPKKPVDDSGEYLFQPKYNFFQWGRVR